MNHRTGYRVRGLLAAFAFFACVLFTSFSAGAEDTSAPAGAMLKPGTAVNSRMKSLAAGTEVNYRAETDDIRAIRMADALPDGFVPTDANTVSDAGSEYPVYIFFDNEDQAGVMYFYTEGGRIALNPDAKLLFSRNTALEDISGITNWDASSAVDMYGMFLGAKSLPDALAIRNWDTSSVTDMSHMFAQDELLLFVDVSGWNTSKVTTMAGMFSVGDSYKGNGQLREIAGLGEMDVSSVTDMTCMFYGAGRMTGYDIAGWDVSRVESMNHMFCDNFSLRSLDLSGWDVSSLKTVFCMFDDNYQLKTIGDVSHWNTASLIDAGGWLNGSVTFVGDNTGTLDLSGWDTRNLKAAGEMFRGTRLMYIDLSGWTFDAITNELWEGSDSSIYYENSNKFTERRGLGEMFRMAKKLKAVFLSEAAMDSFSAAVERGVNTSDMWSGASIGAFTVK